MNTTNNSPVGQNNPYWQEDNLPVTGVANDMLDLVFTIRCRALPMDHAWALSQAIGEALPWWSTEPRAGLHLIYGAASGNGWFRPSGGDDILYLTKRARLTLRLPRSRIADARAILQGRTLQVAGYPLEIGETVERSLGYHPVLYARHVVDTTVDESVFLAEVARELQAMGVRIKKMLPGKSNVLATPEGPCITRSLLVLELQPNDALELQSRGLGPRRSLGCGLFIPHKTLAHVNPDLK